MLGHIQLFQSERMFLYISTWEKKWKGSLLDHWYAESVLIIGVSGRIAITRDGIYRKFPGYQRDLVIHHLLLDLLSAMAKRLDRLWDSDSRASITGKVFKKENEILGRFAEIFFQNILATSHSIQDIFTTSPRHPCDVFVTLRFENANSGRRSERLSLGTDRRWKSTVWDTQGYDHLLSRTSRSYSQNIALQRWPG